MITRTIKRYPLTISYWLATLVVGLVLQFALKGGF